MKPNELRVLAVLTVVLLAATEALLAHNTLYTEGEVMQGLYRLLVGINIPILAVAIWKPRVGLWAAVVLGALLLPWQASENRKWALIHEEVLDIVEFAQSEKKNAGVYPETLGDYQFKRPWIEEHVSYGVKDGTYRLSYFMDNEGITYWYRPEDGFGYYPD